MRAARIAAGLALVIAIPRPAVADEWRFCLAAARAEHRVLLSETFRTVTPLETLQADFSQELARQGIGHDEVQCPRGPDRAALGAMQLNAISFNRQMGNGVVRLGWKPAR